MPPEIVHSIKTNGDARAFGAQKVIAEAAMYRMSRATMAKIDRDNIRPPAPVMRPGNLNPGGAGREGDVHGQIRAAEQQLRHAPTQREQLRIAARLTGLRRQAGLMTRF